MTPTSISGYSFCDQTFVRSKGLCLWVLACASVITWIKSVQRGKSPTSIAFSRSRPLLSRSFATRASASASVRFAIPCWVRKWNLTQMRSFAALIIEKVWLPNKCIWRKLFGMPRFRHRDGDLVQSLVQQCPEVPIVVRAAQPGARVPLDRMVEVGEAQRVAEEEHRRVVADNVPIAFFGVE